MTENRTKHIIENRVQFPNQPIKSDQQELVRWTAEKIRNKANKREANCKQKKTITYKHGQLVLIKNHQLSNTNNNEIKKLFNVFEGPYIITKMISGNTLAIRHEQSGKEMLINVAEVHPYYQMDEPKYM